MYLRRGGHRFALRAMTLVEVVAAALILAVVATSALAVLSSSLESLRTDRAQLTAQHLAANLVAEWRIDPEGVTDSAQGTCSGASGWHWTRRVESLANEHDSALRKVSLTLQRERTAMNAAALSYSWSWVIRDEPAKSSKLWS